MNLKNTHTAALADDMIGAAQILERAAKRLKNDARIVRSHGLACSPEFTDGIVPLFRMHKRHDIECATRLAVAEVMIMEGVDLESQH